ncbi:hypothetical protein DLAC_10128 [Tieghemostelium lacteum]|uniref:Uncharacterized protein n=1 Tax=Tieghemostelium lacteum TaxID=361077 RepID=A0A151Z6A1_TIELA|nr:hypothetical protein DLAC_10128 [Tieghemostelium lacteum]|eukprot:KYQ89457.1 hypothetical protein DLAC_10128 [Tieghemostelium lacteum]
MELVKRYNLQCRNENFCKSIKYTQSKECSSMIDSISQIIQLANEYQAEYLTFDDRFNRQSIVKPMNEKDYLSITPINSLIELTINNRIHETDYNVLIKLCPQLVKLEILLYNDNSNTNLVVLSEPVTEHKSLEELVVFIEFEYPGMEHKELAQYLNRNHVMKHLTLQIRVTYLDEFVMFPITNTSLKSLQSYDIRSDNIERNNFKYLQLWTSPSGFNYLNLSYLDSDVNESIIAYHLSNLTHLAYSISYQDIGYFCKILDKCKTLEKLDIYGNDIDYTKILPSLLKSKVIELSTNVILIKEILEIQHPTVKTFRFFLSKESYETELLNNTTIENLNISWVEPNFATNSLFFKLLKNNSHLKSLKFTFSLNNPEITVVNNFKRNLMKYYQDNKQNPKVIYPSNLQYGNFDLWSMYPK